MQYLLLIYGNEAAMEAATEANSGKMLAAYGAYSEAMAKAGVMVGGNRLRPTSASTTVRAPGGKTQVLDGPYAETKEHIGGFWILEAADMEEALAWGRKAVVACRVPVEVREFVRSNKRLRQS